MSKYLARRGLLRSRAALPRVLSLARADRQAGTMHGVGFEAKKKTITGIYIPKTTLYALLKHLPFSLAGGLRNYRTFKKLPTRT